MKTSKASWFFLPAILSAALLWACYHPLDFGWLGWVALVPFLTLVRVEAHSKHRYFAAWLCGTLFFWPALQWIRIADWRMYFTWAGLALYCSAYTPISVWLIRRLDRLRMPLALSVPVVWTALEFLRAHFGTGFGWYFLAHTQHDFISLIQISDLAGAYAVTFVVAACNALVFELLCKTRQFRQMFRLPEQLPSRLPLKAFVVVILLAASIGYGIVRIRQEAFEPGPRVTLIQGNLDQRIRNEASTDGGEKAAISVVEHYRALCDKAAWVEPKPDLIVWPESSYPEEWSEVDPEMSPDRVPKEWKHDVEMSVELAEIFGKRWKNPMLVGVTSSILQANGRKVRHNSAVLFGADGNVGGRYDKIHRVPFGEYVPFRDWLPWMDKLAPYDFDYSVESGEYLTRFRLGNFRFGVLICYEDTDPVLARNYSLKTVDGDAVDFLLNISNDGWFNGSSEHEAHLAISRFRAIEARRAIGRSVNMGVSAVIDGSGRIVALPGKDWASSKKVSGLVTCEIPIDHRSSVYASLGDWLPWGCWAVIGIGCLISIRNRKLHQLPARS